MKTFISKKKRNQEKRNVNSGTKKTTVMTTITKKMKKRRKSGTTSLTGSSLRTLYCPQIHPPLIWEDRDVIAKNAYRICLPLNVMESLILYGEGM